MAINIPHKKKMLDLVEETIDTDVAEPRSPLPLVHSDLDEYGLDPYEFRIYAHIVRRTSGKLDGECFAKLQKIAETCQMSVRKAQYALKTLCDAGLIIKLPRKGRTDVYKLAPKTNWEPKERLEEIRRKAKQSKPDEDLKQIQSSPKEGS